MIPTLNIQVTEILENLYLEPTLKDLVEGIEAKMVSGDLFRELIFEKNGERA